MKKTPEQISSPEQSKRMWKVLVEMEGYGRDGEEITGAALYEEVIVEAMTADEAEDIAANQDFGNRRVSGVEEPEELAENR